MSSADGTFVVGQVGTFSSNGFWISNDSGQTWTQKIEDKKILDVYLTPTTNKIAVAYINSGGIFVTVSVDKGSTWNQPSLGFGGSKHLAHVAMSENGFDITLVVGGYKSGTFFEDDLYRSSRSSTSETFSSWKSDTTEYIDSIGTTVGLAYDDNHPLALRQHPTQPVMEGNDPDIPVTVLYKYNNTDGFNANTTTTITPIQQFIYERYGTPVGVAATFSLFTDSTPTPGIYVLTGEELYKSVRETSDQRNTLRTFSPSNTGRVSASSDGTVVAYSRFNEDKFYVSTNSGTSFTAVSVAPIYTISVSGDGKRILVNTTEGFTLYSVSGTNPLLFPVPGCPVSRFVQMGPFSSQDDARKIRCMSKFPMTFKIFPDTTAIRNTIDENDKVLTVVPV